MTTSDTNDDSIQTAAQFGNALQRIVLKAHDSGVAIEGGWECSSADARVKYDVVITSVEGGPKNTD